MLLSGTHRIFLAFDVGFEVDLKAAEGRLSAKLDRRAFRRGTRGRGLSTRASPLRFALGKPALIAGLPDSDWLEASLYDFGALCLCYRGSFACSLADLAEASARIQDDLTLVEEARSRAGLILDILGDAVREPALPEIVEDYVVYHVPRIEVPLEHLWTERASEIARVLRAEKQPLSEEEVANAVSARASYSPDDACLVDWFGALIAGEEMEDELRVLELATVELVELRTLDAYLDGRIHGAYDALARSRAPWPRIRGHELQRLGRIQADSALLHQGVDNAVKLLGDDYLARLYRLCSRRFHFDDWDASIERKLSTLDSIYSKLADLAATRRAELLEWIIIVLILLDIVFVFVLGGR